MEQVYINLLLCNHYHRILEDIASRLIHISWGTQSEMGTSFRQFLWFWLNKLMLLGIREQMGLHKQHRLFLIRPKFCRRWRSHEKLMRVGSRFHSRPLLLVCMLVQLGIHHKGLVQLGNDFPSRHSLLDKILGTSHLHHHPTISWIMVRRSLVFDNQCRLFLLGIRFVHHYILLDSGLCKVRHSNLVLEQRR